MKKLIFIGFMGVTACASLPLEFGGSSNQGVKPTPPANQPPAGYVLTEFTDTRGCNYIKTGSGANAIWVPMVSISGSHLCNGGGRSYAVAPEIEDVHGTLVAAQAPQPQPSVPASATNPSIGGFFASLAGSVNNALSGTSSAASAPVLADPVAVAQIEPTTPVPIERPTRVIPAPVAAPAPAPQTVSNPTFAVQVGVYRSGFGIDADEVKLRGLGYVTERKDLGFDAMLQVFPRPGQSAQSLRANLISQGFEEAYIVGVVNR